MHALCPLRPAVHSAAPHGVHAVLPALPANESEGHAAHAVTLLSPSAVYTLCAPLYCPAMHGTHMFGLAPRWQNEPTAQPAAWLHALTIDVGADVGDGVGLGVGTAVGAVDTAVHACAR